MNNALLLLGSNKGNRELILKKVLTKIAENIGRIILVSSIYETAPWGFESKEAFLNLVIKIKTKFSARELLIKVLQIEKELGRTRKKNGYCSRLIDIDILLMDDLQIYEHDLEIPHPRLQNRRFTMVPLAEIAGDELHPSLNKKIQELAESCTDDLKVELYPSKLLTELVENEL
ncbi:MAG: 2-amino-4-hydroxy-6-hydroxymethyldihydropteridine diphosphokinase [Bacteroidales bacterium]|nr:2-amino-4-hydroxy-6-hydroxymethyldihydropteridine diphosphokinase [Bacteroidales bacterium]